MDTIIGYSLLPRNFILQVNEYWAQINENENWTEGKLETQKYAKTVSLFSALSVITSKPAKTWRVYHSDTKKKKKKKKKTNTMERFLNRLYHQSGAPLYHSKVRRCGCWLKILRQRPFLHLTYFTPGKVMMIIRKTSQVLRYSSSGTISMFFNRIKSDFVLVRSLQNSHQWLKFVKMQFLVKSMSLRQQ